MNTDECLGQYPFVVAMGGLHWRQGTEGYRRSDKIATPAPTTASGKPIFSTQCVVSQAHAMSLVNTIQYDTESELR